MSKLRLNSLQNPDSSAVNIELTSTGGAVVSGILTASTIDGGTITATNITSTDLTVEGTITYDDVTNVDSVGVITARNGIDVNAGGIDVNAGGINAVGIVTATSFSGEDYLLSAIDTSITRTATDIFVYDTSKDSDGGAWRKRTQHTSWYNETLNTSTRGSRKEFPAVAVIVAEQNFIRIYDGDDPDLPMWMVFNVGSQGMANTPMVQLSGVDKVVHALNGILVTGTKNETSNYGQPVINFISEKVLRMDSQGGEGGEWMGTIAQRNETIGYRSVDYDYVIAASRVNDVAMTVLPNAPIDDATGLPVPTIAVANDGGTSIIKGDGTVIDITPYADGYVDFDDDQNLIIGRGEGSAIVYAGPIPSADITETSWRAQSNVTYFGPSSSNIELYSSGYDPGDLTGVTKNAFSFDSSIGKVVKFDLNTNDANSTMVAYVATSYNTGWMHGDIKGAFLSDTDTTNVTGGNIVTNGDTWTGASSSTSSTPPNGWTGGNAAQWRTSTGGDGSYIRLVNAGSSQGGPNSYMYQAITTVPGRKYKISLTQYHHATISVYYSVGTSINGGDLVTSTWVSSSSNTPRDEHNTFTATGTTTYLTLGITSGTNNYDTGWDNVVITEVVDDRKGVNANGLHSFGTITKSAVATGAELVAYSGFSNTNVLVQPYNSDLDPGTGNYSFMCWFKCSSTGAEQILMRRFGVPTVTGGTLMRILSSSSSIQWYVRDTSSTATAVNSTMALDDGIWHCAVGTREGSTARLYIDGKLNASSSCSANSHDPGTTASFVIGAEEVAASPGTYQNPADLSSLALVRYSLSAPTAAQVKKMYDDEKFLFQENAKCTLYGSSDEVTAMAYDEDTELLHVGTSAGRSDFQGLRRINNTTTAVTTAISASGELIAEQ